MEGAAALRPEGAGQPGARDGPAMAQGEQGQQPFDGAGADPRQRLAAHGHAQRSEEADSERGQGHRAVSQSVRADQWACRPYANAEPCPEMFPFAYAFSLYLQTVLQTPL